MAKGLRYIGFWLMVAFGILGSLWVAGEAFAEPGGWAAVVLTAAWLVPMLGLALFVWLRPEPAGRVLPYLTAAVLLFVVLDALLGLVGDWGPVSAVLLFALAEVLAFLGWHQPGRAGLLMVVTAIIGVLAVLGSVALHESGVLPPGPSVGSSAMVVAVPLLLVGLLFQLSGQLEPQPPARRTPSRQPVH